MKSDEETNLTEIELTPDGRIFVFGASLQVLQLLDELGLADEGVRQRLRHLDEAASRGTSAFPFDPGQSEKVTRSVES